MSSIRHSRAIHRSSDSPNNMRKSMISTSFTNDMAPGFEDLTRSQIQNLPNHCKADLSSDIVVVFQAIEIERLSHEVEWSRVHIKELERLNFNNQNYEVQIRELTDRIYAFERGKVLYIEENEKMNMICQQLYGELEDLKKRLAGVDFNLGQRYESERARCEDLARQLENWKSRYLSLDRSRAKELEDLRFTMESQRKSILDREMRELTLKFQTERGGLEGQIRKLRDGIEAKSKALSEAQTENRRIQLGLAQLKKSLAQSSENENRVNVLKEENSRLAEMLGACQQELDGMMVRQYQLNQKLKDQERWQADLRQVRQQLEKKQRQAEDWRIRYTNSETNLERMKETQSQNVHLANQLREAEAQLDKLHGLVEEKVDEVEEYKRRLAKQQAETSRCRNLQNQIDSQEKKMAGLTTEIDRLNMLLKARLGDIDQLKSRCQQLELELRKLPQVERRNCDLEAHLNEQALREEELLSKIDRNEAEVRSLRVNEKKLQEADECNRNLERQIGRLNSAIKSKHQELEDLSMRFRRLEGNLSEYKGVETRLRDSENQKTQMSVEIERLNNAIRIKSDECSKIKSKSSSLEEQLSFLRGFESRLVESQQTISNLSLDLENNRRQYSRLEDKCRNVESKLSESERKIAAVMQDKDRLSVNLKTKTAEAEEIRSKLSRLQNENSRLRAIEEAHYQLQNEVTMVAADLEKATRQIKELEREVDRERKTSSECQSNMRNFAAELDKCKALESRQSKEVGEMKEAVYQLKIGVKDRDDNLAILLENVAAFESKIAYLMNELERYVGILNEADQRNCELEEEIQQYQDYAKRITILSAEIDRLTHQNQGLDEDSRRIRLKFAGQISGEMRYEQICMAFCLLCVQVESLRSRLNDKQNHAQEIRRSILEPIRNINRK